jgi:hypothetical protein
MKPKGQRPTMVLMLLFAILIGGLFGQQVSTNSMRTVRVPIALLPESSTSPVSFEGAVLDGRLGEEDRRKLQMLIGRVPYLWGKVESVVTCWPDYVSAAKITRSGRVIFCVKTEDGSWHVSKIIVDHADKF